MNHVGDLDQRWQQLRQAFQAELDDRLRTLNQLLLSLERESGDDAQRGSLLDALQREVHSLKGAARAVELEPIERLAHAAETSLQRARQHPGPLDGSWFDLLYRATDLLEPLYRSILEHEAPPADLDELVEQLDRWPAPPTAATAGPTSPVSQRPIPSVQDEPPALAPTVAVASPTLPAEPTVRLHSASESVRVAVNKLDLLFAQTGELAVSKIRIEQRLRDLKSIRGEIRDLQRSWRITQRWTGEAAKRPETLRAAGAPSRYSEDRIGQQLSDLIELVEQTTARLQDDTTQLATVSRTIEDEVLSIRLFPIAPTFTAFERAVRDLTRATGKQVQLVTRGGEIELDRRILEELRDPLLHMLRNAVDHGLEAPAARLAAGKPEVGTITLAAAQRDDQIEIEVSDDGQGIDPERLRAAAVRNRMLSTEQAAGLDDQEALELIFAPGLSTSESVTETSGRGVGMDVVRESLERIHGRITTTSVVGQGTRFTIMVPLTLATSRVIVVGVHDQLLAVPSWMVERCTRTDRAALVRIGGKRCLSVDGRAIPAVELASVLGRARGISEHSERGGWIWALVLRQGDQAVALLVDRLVSEQELTVKPLPWPLKRVRNLSGVSVLEAGETVLILNPSDLFKSAAHLLGAPSAGERVGEKLVVEPADRPARRSRLLVVDDSLTTRMLERSILEASGYEVVVASDGLEALQVLRTQEIDLIVTDVDMPNMDGFTLTATVRADEKLRQLPVVLVTSLEEPEHRKRGVQVGADAHIVKRGFDQAQLLETIGRLL
jgi:two-component system chemotaxis sensor kinase CheA